MHFWLVEFLAVPLVLLSGLRSTNGLALVQYSEGPSGAVESGVHESRNHRQKVEVVTKTRHLQVGDSWSYTVTTRYPYKESWNQAAGRWEAGETSGEIHRSRNLDYHGTLTVKVIKPVDSSTPTTLGLLKNLKFSRKNRDIDQTWVVYFEQDPDTGMVTGFRKDPTTNDKQELGCLVPGEFSEGLSYDSLPLYGVRPRFNSSISGIDAEESETFASVVSGPEKIRVKAGEFQAWKVSRTSNSLTDFSDNVWFAPELGYFVKILESSPTGSDRFPKCLEIIELATTTILKPK